MRSKDLNILRRKLEDWRARILSEADANFSEGTLRNINDASDEMDFASRDAEESCSYRIHDRSLKLLRKVEDALERMEVGNFGICEDCEEPIVVARLYARPITTLCVQCKGDQERRERTLPDVSTQYPTRSIINDWAM